MRRVNLNYIIDFIFTTKVALLGFQEITLRINTTTINAPSRGGSR